MSPTTSTTSASADHKLKEQFESGARSTIKSLVEKLAPPTTDSEGLENSLLGSLLLPPKDFPVGLERLKQRSGYTDMKGVYDVKSDYEGILSKRDDGVMELSLDVGVSVKNIRGRADGKEWRQIGSARLRSEAESTTRSNKWETVFKGAYPLSSTGYGNQ